MLSRIYYRYTYSINESTSLHKWSIDYTESKCAIRAWLAACMHTFSAHWTIKIWAILGSRSTANPHVVLYVGRHSDIKKLASCNHACATYIECALFKCRDKEETQDSSLLHWVESGTWSINCICFFEFDVLLGLFLPPHLLTLCTCIDHSPQSESLNFCTRLVYLRTQTDKSLITRRA